MKTNVKFKIYHDKDLEEYQVQVWINGTLNKDKTYHTDDREDALATKQVMQKELVEHPDRYGIQVEKPRPITFEQWFEILQGFVKAGNCLIDDVYGVHKINRVSLADNSKGKATGIIFKSAR